MPGGSTRATVLAAPFPPCAARGAGARLWDEDGHEYLNLVNNFFFQVHGHAQPAIAAAVQHQAAAGLSSGLPTATEVELLAVKAARAHTGRPAVPGRAGGATSIALTPGIEAGPGA